MRTLVSLLALLALLGRAPAADSGSPALGDERIPGGDFSELRPDWRQMRAQGAELLVITPPGWHVDHLGGAREMPMPGVDPDTRDRCIVFLYGAGRMDLFTEPFLLEGAGEYRFSLRTRSVVNPSARLLRSEIRLLPDSPEMGAAPLVTTFWFGAGPEPRVWSASEAIVQVPAGYGRAEVHLIKEEDRADFLLDDVSLRRIQDGTAAPAVPPAALAPGAGPAGPYAGLRAWGGDPQVRVGLALYEVVNPGRPLARGTPEGAFASARENGLDWAAVANPSSHIDAPAGRRWREEHHRPLPMPDGSESWSEWEHLRAVVRHANEPGAFAAFLAVEYDGDGYDAKGGSGRKLILLPGDDVPQYCSPHVLNAGDCPAVRDAYRYTRHYGGVMMALSPCRAAGDQTTDWSRHDPLVVLADLFGGHCERSRGGYLDANVRQGLFLGAGGGSASAEGIAGLHDRTICWAPELTRPAILDAMRLRRCYWSAAGHLEMKFSIDGAPMGSRIPAGKQVAWSVEAQSRDALGFARVEILRDGLRVDTAACTDPRRCGLTGGTTDHRGGLYYAALDGTDGRRVAVSSPILVTEEYAP